MNRMLNRVIALAGAVWLSLKYRKRLGIRNSELARYFAKSMNLAVCYSGFSMPGNHGQAFRAGKGAFLCCAYDVVTDWRQFDSCALEIGKGIILAETNSSIADIFLELLAKDINDQLAEDGLERGSLALRFVTRLIGSEDFYAEKVDVDYAGRLWQLVDDLLDYEDDLQVGDLNCLASSNRIYYLEQAELLLLEPFASVFLQDRVLAYVTRRAVDKARLISLAISSEKEPGLRGGSHGSRSKP